MIETLIDDALEISVLGSFSRVGYDVRRGLFDWSAPTTRSLAGRTALVTGATSGLGREAVDQLATTGCRIVLVGRDELKLASARDRLVRTHGEDRFPTTVADLASLDSVDRAVRHVLATETRLDILVDNAGAMFARRESSSDGIEATLATMVVGPFALIAGLLPLLRRTAGARVVSVTSGGQYAQGLRLGDLQWAADPFDGPRAYAHAKRAQVCLMREWTRRIPPAQIAFTAMHPGWADTPGIASALPGFYRWMGPLLRTPAQGADTMVWLATDPDAAALAGRLVLDRRARPFDRMPWTRVRLADRRRLWDAVVHLARIADPVPDTATGQAHAGIVDPQVRRSS